MNKKKRVNRGEILKYALLILLMFSFMFIISSQLVSAPNSQTSTPINRFYTPQAINRTPPDMGVSGYPAADITSGMVGYWKCDGDFTDSSGEGNDGTQSGGVAIGRGVKGRGCDEGNRKLINE